jgi:hypothetical protein
VTVGFVISACPHGTSRLPLYVFSLNVVFEDFSKTCWVNLSWINLLKLPATLRTTGLTSKNSTWKSHCLCVFCMDLRRNSHISLYNINRLDFITEVECVYCAVRTESLYITCVKHGKNDWHFTLKIIYIYDTALLNFS